MSDKKLGEALEYFNNWDNPNCVKTVYQTRTHLRTFVILAEFYLSHSGEWPDVLEDMANVEHVRWSGWQKYLHSKCTKNDDGSLTIPAGYVRNLERLIKTSYRELTEQEKESDRDEARKSLQVCKLAMLNQKEVPALTHLFGSPASTTLSPNMS
jgi:hypothetical protein